MLEGPSRLTTLVWDASPDSNVAGYRVFYGIQSGTYTNQVDVGNQTQYQPPTGFDWSKTLYFAVLAYNTSGLTSPLSNEAKWTPSATTKVTSVRASVSYPLLAGHSVTWTATATNALYPIEYRFWLYRKTGWTMVKDYSSGNTFSWTPTQADVGEPYAVQVWARAVGSSLQYESWLGTETFAVTVLPFQISADVDFPTPPGNQVTWTAQVAATSTSPLEYRFLVTTQDSSVWTVLREYATSNVALWTPAAIGTYAIQAWARRVGSTAQYEYIDTTDFFSVSQTPLSVTALTTDVSSPAIAGTKVTWTARVKGGMAGPIQYQFWLYSSSTGWKLAQPYGATETFTWTPTWGDEGDYSVQVWVRSDGSTASYESWRSSTPFRIDRAPMKLTTATLFPVAPGSFVDWRADVADPTANLEYQFWLYSTATANWTIARSYGVDPTFRWIPASVGTYAVQAWARAIGSSATYDVLSATNLLQVSQGPAQLQTLTSNVALPATSGTTIKWTATANGGTAGPLQYQFWLWSSNGWTLVQNYSSLNTYSWTPTTIDVGDHALQVWVRSAGSSAAYESYKSTGVFSIK